MFPPIPIVMVHFNGNPICLASKVCCPTLNWIIVLQNKHTLLNNVHMPTNYVFETKAKYIAENG